MSDFEKEVNTTRNIGLQFFAEPDGGEEQETEEKEEKQDEKKEEKNDEPDLDAIKKQWLKDMGFDDEDDEESVKEIAKKHKEEKEKKLTDEQKQNKKILEEKSARIAAERDAAQSKAMVKAMKMGAKPDCVEEVVTLVMAKTKGKDSDFDSAFEEIKKKVPSLFVESDEQDKDPKKKGLKGTGSSLKDKDKKDTKYDSIGERLAKMRSAANKKSVYFGK